MESEKDIVHDVGESPAVAGSSFSEIEALETLEGGRKDALVVYFSRTGKTKAVAEKIAKYLNADIKEVMGEEDFSGVLGALKLSYRALMKNKSNLKNPPVIESCYKAIWVGGPVHASSLASPLFAWIEDNKDLLKSGEREVFLFGTEGGSGHNGMFSQAEAIMGTKVLKKVIVLSKDVEAFDPEKSLRTGEEKHGESQSCEGEKHEAK